MLDYATWREDCTFLRQLAHEELFKRGLLATFLFTLISHMRGHVHMGTFAKYKGGWRSFSFKMRKMPELDKKLLAAYGETALFHYSRSVIENLEDQEEWIRKYSEEILILSEDTKKVIERVLSKKWAPPIKDQLWKELEAGENHDQSLS